MYFEKDAEIEFLQKELSAAMKEKCEKELIIKSKHSHMIHFYSIDLRELKTSR